MKKAKILLTITTVLALLGGAFAIKTSRANTARRNGPWVCTTSTLPVATCSLRCITTNPGQGTWWYCTKTINPGLPCSFLIFGTTNGA